jgi:hypothetical protein
VWYAGVLTAVFIVLGALTLVFLRQYLEASVFDTQAPGPADRRFVTRGH